MALIICPDCGKQVSDQAISCPFCGRPINSPAIVATPPAQIQFSKMESVIAQYQSNGWILISKTERTAQLKKPKQFNWAAFLLLLLIFGLGLLYLLYYLVKNDEYVLLSLDEQRTLMINGKNPLDEPQSITQASKPITPITDKENRRNLTITIIFILTVLVLVVLMGVFLSH